MKRSRLAWATIASTSILLGSAVVHGQDDAGRADAAAAGGLEEVLVTSQKRGTEVLQRAPISATAVNMVAVERGQLTDLRDVARLAPNVQLETSASFPGFANFTIRGLTLNNSLRTIDPAVAIVVDGMAFGDPLGMVLDTFDMESMEILRGPQGVLIGRNATGGAVVMQTRRPDDEFAVRGSVRAGSPERFDQSLSIEGPIADTLRAKIAVLHREGDGFFKDRNGGVVVPTPANNFGVFDNPAVEPQVGEDIWVTRGALNWTPTDTLDINLVAEYQDANFGGNASRVIQARPPLVTGYGYTPPASLWELDHNVEGYALMETTRAALNIDWTIGNGTLTSVTGYRQLDYFNSSDNDGTPFTILHFPDNEADSHHITQELRYLFDVGSNFKVLLGGYFSDLEMTQLENREVNLVLAGVAPPAPMIRQQTWFDQDSQTQAFFANVDWTATERMTISAGLRYTYEEKEIEIALLRVCPAASDFSTCPTDTVTDKEDWDDLSPRLAIDYEVSDNVFLFASYASAFRSGSFNGRATTAPSVAASDPEEARTIEVGIKSELLNNRLRANLALFHTDFTDIQATLVGPDTAQTILNAADATIKGVELELTLLAAEGLTLHGVFGYTDAEYGQFDGLDLTGDGVPDPDLAKQLEFPRVPEMTATAMASYEFQLPNVAGDFATQVQYAWRDSIYTDLVNTPQTKVPAYGLLDASLTYSPSDNLSVTLYGKNLTEEENWEINISAPFAWIVNGGIGRSYGLEARFTF